MSELIKEYRNDDITVVWYPAKCTQSQCCFKAYKEVFDPSRKPWIQLDKGATAEIIKTVEACPSGALSYYFNKATDAKTVENPPMRVKLSQAGSVKIEGTFLFIDEKGNEQLIENETIAICRCEKSLKMPYCDGMHKTLEAWKKLQKPV